MNKAYKNEESNLHSGHRKRLKNKYATLGAEGLSDEELLELMLFFAVPQRDTAPLAKALLNRYGSLSAMMDTPREHLMEVNGVNEHTALFLSLLTDVSRIYRMDKLSEDNLFSDNEKIARYLAAYLAADRQDSTAMMCFDRQGRLLCCETVFSEPVEVMGTCHVRTVAQRALGVGAHAVALAHVHSSGIPEPSENDMSSTTALAIALGNLDVKLIEHFVVTDKGCVGIIAYTNAAEYENAL